MKNQSNDNSYNYVFHYNHYTDIWSAIHRDNYKDYWNNSEDPRILKARDITGLLDMIEKLDTKMSLLDKLS